MSHHPKPDPQFHMRTVMKQRRKTLGLTQADVASILNIPRMKYHRIENGTRNASFEEIASISGGLQLPIEDLLGKEDAKVFKRIVDDIARKD
jgi:transcriptional regulator with XRE-family HTH domain